MVEVASVAIELMDVVLLELGRGLASDSDSGSRLLDHCLDG